jgi:hypothetical protein
LQGVLADAARAAELDAFDNVLGRLTGARGSRRLGRGYRSWRRLRGLGWLGGLLLTLRHGLKRIGRLGGLLLLRWLLRAGLILGRGLTNSNHGDYGEGAKHPGSQAAQPEKNHFKQCTFHRKVWQRQTPNVPF